MIRWNLENNDEEKDRIRKIAKQRYKGWRAQLSSTYRAYNSYHQRMKHKPEDLDIVEWHYLVLYSGTDKFQRDLETGEEPDGLVLWRSIRSKEDRWSSDDAKEEKSWAKINERIKPEGSVLSKIEESHILHETYKETTGCRTKKGPGHGYLAKYPTRSQLMNERVEEQARAAALAVAAQQKNNETQAELDKLKEQLASQAAERESDKEKIEQLQQQLQNTKQEMRQEFLTLMELHKGAMAEAAAVQTTTTHQPAQLTTNAAATDNLVGQDEDTPQTGIETAMATNNKACDEPPVVPTPSLEEHLRETLTHSALSTHNKNQSSRVTRSGANRSLFPNDKGCHASGKFITPQTLKNNAAAKKRDLQKQNLRG